MKLDYIGIAWFHSHKFGVNEPLGAYEFYHVCLYVCPEGKGVGDISAASQSIYQCGDENS